jgi:hypothetical protein
MSFKIAEEKLQFLPSLPNNRLRFCPSDWLNQNQSCGWLGKTFSISHNNYPDLELAMTQVWQRAEFSPAFSFYPSF